MKPFDYARATDVDDAVATVATGDPRRRSSAAAPTSSTT